MVTSALVSGFVDDIVLKLVVCSGRRSEAVATMALATALLDTLLARHGFRQNPSKRMVAPQLLAKEMWAMGKVLGVTTATRYLGGLQIFHRLGNRQELERRAAAANAAWAQLQGYWFSGGPQSVKRLMLISKVQSCLLSGLETYYLRQADYKYLDLQLGKKLRAVLQGRACSKEDELYVARTGDFVFQEFRMVPLWLELRVRRLRWLQAALAQPSEHAQWLGAIFGATHFDGAVLESDGALTEHANCFAAQFMADVASLGEDADLPDCFRTPRLS